MTRVMLYRSVGAVIGLLFLIWLVAFVAAFGGFGAASSTIYGWLKDFASIPIGICAAFLALCFQKRQTFLVSLRDLWHSAIDARIAAISYTYIEAPEFSDFSRAHSILSKTIDQVRGVYRNIDETDESIGYFPFDPLHDIRRSLDRLIVSDFSEATRVEERERIWAAWHAFRWIFLKEFGTPRSTYVIAKRNSVDPRRQPRHPDGGN